MPSAWINHVKKFATEHKIKFGEALADKRCSASYKSLQSSTTRHGPKSFLPVDAAPKKKSVKKTKSKSEPKKKSRSNSRPKRKKSKRSKSRN